MLTQETIEKMNAMKLFGLVAAFGTQLSSSEYDELSFEERVGLLVDAEWTDRERRKLSRRYFRVNERFRSLPDDLRPRGRCHCCQVDEKLADRPPRYWARARREPAMLGIRNGCQPQLDSTPMAVCPSIRDLLFCGSQARRGQLTHKSGPSNSVTPSS